MLVGKGLISIVPTLDDEGVQPVRLDIYISHLSPVFWQTTTYYLYGIGFFIENPHQEGPDWLSWPTSIGINEVDNTLLSKLFMRLDPGRGATSLSLTEPAGVT